jgi:hypothetical protein
VNRQHPVISEEKKNISVTATETVMERRTPCFGRHCDGYISPNENLEKKRRTHQYIERRSHTQARPPPHPHRPDSHPSHSSSPPRPAQAPTSPPPAPPISTAPQYTCAPPSPDRPAVVGRDAQELQVTPRHVAYAVPAVASKAGLAETAAARLSVWPT